MKENGKMGKPSERRKTPPRVAARMEGKVKNRGTKPVKKAKRSD